MKFEPICYEHVAKLIGMTPWEVSRNSELLAKSHAGAIQEYGLQDSYVGIDIYNVEAEIYGCEITKPEGEGVPAILNPIFSLLEEISTTKKIDPEQDGRFPVILEAAKDLKKKFPEVNIHVPLAGPFSIACHLLGLENMLCEMITNPEKCNEALRHLAENQYEISRKAEALGLNITIFESSATPPLVPPEMFKDIIEPILTDWFNFNYSLNGKKSTFIMGGDTFPVLRSLMNINPSYLICPIETDQIVFMQLMVEKPETTVRVNMNPQAFLSGNIEIVTEEIERVEKIASLRENTTIGSVMPYEAEPAFIKEVINKLECR